MKISIRLEEVLDQLGAGGRGAVARICKHNESLKRHQVADILNNRSRYVSLTTLAGICDYLVNRHHVDRAQLPGLLFRLDPEDLMSLLAERSYLGVCVGMRVDDSPADRTRPLPPGSGPTAKRQSVMASDAFLHGVVMHERFGGRLPEQEIHQRLIAAYGLESDNTHAGEQAGDVYDDFCKRHASRALICLGSVKCNPIAELIMAEIWRAIPFKPQDSVNQPRLRRSPIFLRYRDDDFSPPSCHGGKRLSRGRRNGQPGIWYETASGKWECCPCAPEADAALVVYADYASQSRVETVLGGFSGRATFCLAAALPRLVGRFWPPNYQSDELQVGAFVVRFTFGGPDADALSRRDAPWIYNPTETKVIRLDEEVLRRRLDGKK